MHVAVNIAINKRDPDIAKMAIKYSAQYSG